MTDKPSIPFAETVGLLLKNAGVTADEQLARSLAMAIAIKFQETQQERDDAIWEQAEQQGRAAGLAEAVKAAEQWAAKNQAAANKSAKRASRAILDEHAEMHGLESAHLQTACDELLALAAAFRALSTSPGEHVLVPADCRQWKYHVMPMPISAEGHGPATIGQDAVRIEYEVWEAGLMTTIGSFEYLPDAINCAMLSAKE